MEISTERSLVVGNMYDVLAINLSIGGRGYSFGQETTTSTPVCFPKHLRYDGNDEEGLPLFSERFRAIYDNGNIGCNQYRPYNDDNFIVVGILPERLEMELKHMDNAAHYYKQSLKITPVVIKEESEYCGEDNEETEDEETTQTPTTA